MTTGSMACVLFDKRDFRVSAAGTRLTLAWRDFQTRGNSRASEDRQVDVNSSSGLLRWPDTRGCTDNRLLPSPWEPLAHQLAQG